MKNLLDKSLKLEIKIVDEQKREQLLFEVGEPVCYPDGTTPATYTGNEIPKITPDNIGALHEEIHKLKAIIIAMLTQD